MVQVVGEPVVGDVVPGVLVRAIDVPEVQSLRCAFDGPEEGGGGGCESGAGDPE